MKANAHVMADRPEGSTNLAYLLITLCLAWDPPRKPPTREPQLPALASLAHELAPYGIFI